MNDYHWIFNSEGIVFTADEARTPEEQKEYEAGADAIFIDEAPNGKENARFGRLWAFDLKSGKEILICKKNLVISEFDISKDGKKVVFTAAPDTRTNYPFLAELYMVKTDGTGFLRLTHNGAPEEDPQWSPDGKYFYFNELQGTNTNLFRINIKTDKLEAMTDVKGTLRPKCFSADKKTIAYTLVSHIWRFGMCCAGA